MAEHTPTPDGDRTCIIIPARSASTRLPGKLLLAETGQSLLEHTYRNARQTGWDVYVACPEDDADLIDLCTLAQLPYLPTSRPHECGSTRVAEAATRLQSRYSFVVNVQGDCPSVEAGLLHRLVRFLKEHSFHSVVTASCPLPAGAEDLDSVVKVVVSSLTKNALYFSRLPLPGAQQHVGVYAFRAAVLPRLIEVGVTHLAQIERLEQLAFLELGLHVGVVHTTEYTPHIDTRDDYDDFVATQNN